MMSKGEGCRRIPQTTRFQSGATELVDAGDMWAQPSQCQKAIRLRLFTAPTETPCCLG